MKVDINHKRIGNTWFFINALLTLSPPLYLAISDHVVIAGLPLTLIYFLAVSASCGLSVIYVSWTEMRP